MIDAFVDGVSCQSRSSGSVEIINPSNGRACGTLAVGSDVDADHAVAAARRAFDDGRWSDAPPSFRHEALASFSELILQHSSRLDELDAREMGKPVSERVFNAAAAAGRMKFCAEAIDMIAGDVYGSDKTSFVAQRRVPRGVMAAVVPWNFPTFNAVLKIAPALAAGNCIVLKPSELSPSSALLLAELAMQAGLPAGVLNVVPGLGETVGRALALHPDVNLISFTGSTAVGKLMLQYAGQSNMKVVMAECGGKSPHIVFDDGVDLESVSDVIAGNILTNQGQICSVGSRLLVQRGIEKLMVEKIAARVSRVVMGDALDPRTSFGPVVSAVQLDRVMGYVDKARAEGLELVAGGARALPESGGYFVQPTIFRNVPASARLAQEEIFGPVLAVTAFEDEAEAIRLANGTVYGLAAYVWTAGLGTGMRMARGVKSSVLVNAVAPAGEGAGHAVSSEPVGMSGLGVEGGLAGIESYLRRQLVWINHG